MTTAPASGTVQRKPKHLLIFAVTAIVVLLLGGTAYVYFYPPLLYGALEKVVVKKGLGTGAGIPLNTLYTVPQLASPTTTKVKSNVLIDGTNHDTLYTVGWLNLSKHAEELHVPDMAGRYYSIEFVNPSNGDVFAYVGRRTTGTSAGTFQISGPGSHSAGSLGAKVIRAPNDSVLVIGRTLVTGSKDLATAYDLAKQIHLTADDDQ